MPHRRILRDMKGNLKSMTQQVPSGLPTPTHDGLPTAGTGAPAVCPPAEAAPSNLTGASGSLTGASASAGLAHSRKPRKTYLIVDGENIDGVLGNNLLGGRRPFPDERPRWDRIAEFARTVWDQDVVPLFFLNATSGTMPMSFIQALLAMGYRPIPLQGSGDEKVVDVGIQRMLEALASRDGDVLLASHDGDFLPQVEALLGADRRVGLLAFREFVNLRLSQLAERGLDTFDLEMDVRAFNTPLPRIRIIPLAEFNPLNYL